MDQDCIVWWKLIQNIANYAKKVSEKYVTKVINGTTVRNKNWKMQSVWSTAATFINLNLQKVTVKLSKEKLVVGQCGIFKKHSEKLEKNFENLTQLWPILDGQIQK